MLLTQIRRIKKRGKDMEKVLIVDDSAVQAAKLRSILEDEYEITVAQTAEDGLRRASSEDYSRILLDVVMPGMDGFTLLKKLQEEIITHSVPVILITSLSDVSDEQRGLILGAVDYITKPFNPLIVKARVNTHIKLYRYRLVHHRIQLFKINQDFVDIVASQLFRFNGLLFDSSGDKLGLNLFYSIVHLVKPVVKVGFAFNVVSVIWVKGVDFLHQFGFNGIALAQLLFIVGNFLVDGGGVHLHIDLFPHHGCELWITHQRTPLQLGGEIGYAVAPATLGGEHIHHYGDAQNMKKDMASELAARQAATKEIVAQVVAKLTKG